MSQTCDPFEFTLALDPDSYVHKHTIACFYFACPRQISLTIRMTPVSTPFIVTNPKGVTFWDVVWELGKELTRVMGKKEWRKVVDLLGKKDDDESEDDSGGDNGLQGDEDDGYDVKDSCTRGRDLIGEARVWGRQYRAISNLTEHFEKHLNNFEHLSGVGFVGIWSTTCSY
ncbi:hypothetical protein JAAARDRAFT_48150 [Jaapia argillacea MUCL 33604]|uniref:Uncharacterized protein n=1 Tax=Jaapia argillacea MUCL 33604 TaxID=933084 RepID=A0A067PN38_9AGAM|nr:hypothetical protein JAAARDRAFT_48150 [Jaapia argillacea MUCL 33604]